MTTLKKGTPYRGEFIALNTGEPVGRKGRYTWRARTFAQLNHAKTAIDDELKRT